MKKTNLLKRITATLVAAVTISLSVGGTVLADELPYDCYNYDYWNNIVKTPAPYVPAGSVTGLTLGVGNFVEPQDLCVDDDGLVYVADTGNNRIVVMDENMKNVVRIIDEFNGGDKFSAPSGVCVSENMQLYVADSNHKRVVVLTPEGEFVKIIDNPQSEILSEGFDFVPLKVTVDYADRVYVIAKNVFEGIMVFESTGEFTGYFGTIEVKISMWEKFWRKLASKEERNNSQLFIPTEFTGIDVDAGGFIYASNIDPDGIRAVRRLNPQGKDVIQKGENGNVGGSLWGINGYGTYNGASEITDVVYRGKGMYSLLDRKRGRVFTYDKEGNLLYIFGGLGSQEGTFRTPVAIENVKDKVVVLDAYYGSIMLFEETRYGYLINTAVGLRFDGDEALAVELWEEVLKLDENNELANTGIGKAYLSAGDNKNAMKYLKLGMNRKYYSIAWKRYRNEWLSKNMNVLMTALVLIVILLIVDAKLWKPKRKAKKAKKKEEFKAKKREGGLA